MWLKTRSMCRMPAATGLTVIGLDGRQLPFDAMPDNGKVQPQEVVQSMMTLPPETIFTHGAGDHGFYGYMVPVATPGAHLVSTRLGTMGSTLGLALGAKLARPEQTVVGCVGDGDFMLQIGDLETMARENLGVVMVVFNNFRLGSQRKRVEAYGTVMGVDHGNPDFARLAELFGCRGYRVDQPGSFDETFREALTTGAPCVIDVIMDPDARPPRIAAGKHAKRRSAADPAGYEALAVESNGALGSHRNAVDSQEPRLTDE